MKIDMKITQRDKKLLVFLTILLMIIGFGVFLITPLAGQIKREFLSWQEQQQLQQENEEKIQELSTLRGVHKQLKGDLEKAIEGFYTPMSSYEIDQLLTNQILEDGLTPRQLEITMPIDNLILDPFIPASQKQKEEKGDQNETEASKERYPCILSAQVNLSVSGSSKKLQSFVDTLIKESPSIRVTSLHFDNESEDNVENQVDLDVALYIYMVKV